MGSMERQNGCLLRKEYAHASNSTTGGLSRRRAVSNAKKPFWDLFISGERQVAKMTVVNGKTVELVCRETGEIFTYTIGRGFE